MKKTVFLFALALAFVRLGFSQSITTGTPFAGNIYHTGGNIGIGTTTPTNILSLGGTTARIIWMERNTTAGTAGQGLTLSSGGATSGGTNLAGGDLTFKSGISTGTGTSTIHFYTSPVGSSGSSDNIPTEKMTITGAGKVGIGTNAPSALLHLYGAAANAMIAGLVSSISLSTDNIAGGNGDALPGGNYIIGTTAKNTSIITSGQGTPGIGNIGKISLLYRRTSVSAYYLSALEISDKDGSSGYGNLLLMKSGGNVGIGTTSPSQKLSVAGSGRLTDSLYLNKKILGTSDSILVRESNVVKYKLLSASQFWTRNSGSGYIFPTTLTDKIGIGINNPVASLDIKALNSDPALIVRDNDSIHFRVRANGFVEARDILVRTGIIIPDYVFEKDYNLKSLNEVENYIYTNKHLPDVPSAADIKKDGLNVAEMDAILLKKVEEQTLYIIDLQKQIIEMQKEINLLK